MELDASVQLKEKLKRIVSLLTRMVMKWEGVGESSVEYEVGYEYE